MIERLPDPAGPEAVRTSLELADWRRRIATLYAEVRERAQSDPRLAWDRWRAVRDAMYRDHPQSPVPPAVRAAFRSSYWPYEPALRLQVGVASVAASAPPPGLPGKAAIAALPVSTGSPLVFTRLGRVTLPFPSGPATLDLFWVAGYAGGVFLPFLDATNGRETYGGGRYLLDTAKGADLGGDPATDRLILDFNFAFQPSCAFDPRWACPLAPSENRLDLRVEAGERIA